MKGLGTVVLDKITKVSSGKDHGTIEATFKWLDPAKKQLITETRTMTFYDDPNLRTIDFESNSKRSKRSRSATPRKALSPSAWRTLYRKRKAV